MKRAPVRRRRWHRIVIPYAVVLLIFALTGLARALERPDFDAPGTLSPTGTGADGSSRLAALLAGQGITVERHTRSVDALRSAMTGGATVFVPEPDLPNPNLTRLLSTVPADIQVVLVAPTFLAQHGLPVTHGLPRWAARAAPPGCADPLARRAGPATTVQYRYVAVDTADTRERHHCYSGGLLGMRWHRIRLVVVGAHDPFRNSRIGERGNAELATGLLAAHPRVIWLDLHAAEKVSYSTVDSGGITITLPDPEDGSRAADGPTSPLWTALPPAFWPVLVQLLLVALILALWRARRLGPPVPEPLPVVVPSIETVTGRGRLYQRAGAWGPALDTLRAAALRRLRRALRLPANAGESDVVEAVAGRVPIGRQELRQLLYGPVPPGDPHIRATIGALDALVHEVSRDAGRRPGEEGTR